MQCVFENAPKDRALFLDYFLLFTRTFTDSKCEVIITGRRANLGDNKGMQVPCKLQFVGNDKHIRLLKKELIG